MECDVQIKCIMCCGWVPLCSQKATQYSAVRHPSNTHYHSHRCTECQLQLHICDISIIIIVKQYKILTNILTVKPSHLSDTCLLYTSDAADE